MTFLTIVIPLSVLAHADTVTVSLWLGKMWKTTQCSPADSDIETTASVIHGILARVWSGSLSAAAESLMAQDVGSDHWCGVWDPGQMVVGCSFWKGSLWV